MGFLVNFYHNCNFNLEHNIVHLLLLLRLLKEEKNKQKYKQTNPSAIKFLIVVTQSTKFFTNIAQNVQLIYVFSSLLIVRLFIAFS